MKEFIEYNYDLFCNDLKVLDDLLYFKYKEKYYIISTFERDELEFEKIISFLTLNNVKYLNIIFNKNGNYISEFNGKKYVLMVSNDENNVIDFPKNVSVLIDMENRWGTIWEGRVLQLEKQKNEVGLNKDVYYILNYYIGLIEICIFNYNLIIKKFGSYTKSCIQHNRINIPINSFSYYNSVNFLFDCCVRDLAEYVKMCFFQSDFSVHDALEVLSVYVFNDFSANMFLVRMMYPTYFLEVYDSQNKDVVYSNLFSDLIKKSSQYENFLVDLISFLANKYNIFVKFPFIFRR